MNSTAGALDWTAVAVGLLVGAFLAPWLARATVRLAARNRAARPSGLRVVLTGVLAALLLGFMAGFAGVRPALAGFAWVAAAGLVLAAVDAASHRLPDRVTFPAAAVCTASFLADAAVLGTWPALLRGVVAALAAFAVGALAAAVSPAGLGFGDVKLLGLLGLVLGWVGWETLLLGVFLGLVLGAVVALALLVAGRAGWRTALPFGPPLLGGALLALVLHGSLALS